MSSTFKQNELYRLPTGIRKTTVPFYAEDFHGDPEDYDFKRQTAAYEALRDTLAAMGLKFTEMGASNITDKRAHWTLYVGKREAPFLIWEKYEGLAAMGAQNRLFVRSEMFKMTHFMGLSLEARIELLEPCALRRSVSYTHLTLPTICSV